MPTTGVHSIEEFGLQVPDLDEACAFYDALGLTVRREGDRIGLYAEGSDHRWTVITQSPAKRLSHLAFGAFPGDFEAIAARVRARGIDAITPPRGGSPGGLWVRDPAGVAVQIRIAPKATPDRKPTPPSSSAPAGRRGAPATAERPPIRPQRFSHIACFTPDVPASVAFYTEVLGLAVADHVGDVVAFLRAIHGSDHHVLALAQAAGPGMHHCSWDVGNFDNVGLGGRQMEDRGYPYARNWGPGRHVIGSNYFYYVRDPWGSYAELTADMDFVEPGAAWTDRAYGMEDALYLWGPPPPANFLSNREIERGAR